MIYLEFYLDRQGTYIHEVKFRGSRLNTCLNVLHEKKTIHSSPKVLQLFTT